MTNAFTTKQITLAVSCALALGILSGVARAADAGLETDPAKMGYLVDERGNVALSGFGLCWHSGVGPAPASAPAGCGDAAPAPAARAVEPAPKPAPVAAAAPKPAATPVVRRVTLDADALFDFDKAVLRPAGKVALDDFVAKTKDIKPEVINATGHTDRFGTEAYNQRLSERRVAAVKTYLVSKGIEASRIHTEGKGETQPVTKAGECTGRKSAKVVACLQPDRRVEIEVVGNRIDK